MERAEWDDRRIGDNFRMLWERVGALDKTNERLAIIERELPEFAAALRDLARADDVVECRQAIKALTEAFAKRAEAREEERKAHTAERKADRRWQFGAVLAGASLVIAALALLLPILLGPPA